MTTPERGLALVTGASAGIGRECCVQLAARGYDLILVARDRERLDALGAELRAKHGIEVESAPADLSRDADVDRIVALIEARPRLSLLVNNAGFGTKGTLATADRAGQEAMVRLHALAPLRLIQAALPGMRRQRAGAIVNVASVAAFTYSPGNATYCATKAYLVTLTEGLAVELEGTGVQAQALCPGFTRSEFHERMGTERRGPSWVWLSAERVVRDSLKALDRRGPVVVVPGLHYRAAVYLLRLVPRRLIGRVARRRAALVVLLAATLAGCKDRASATGPETLAHHAARPSGFIIHPRTPADSMSRGTAAVSHRVRRFWLKSADSARWPVASPPRDTAALLPASRIVAYYGNPLSKRMGILGQIPPDSMLTQLEAVAQEWAAADPGRPVRPALHLIATVAQGQPGRDGKYRLRMTDSLIGEVASWVERRNWLLILDIQTGHSTVEAELPRLLPFLARPYVHLALDPEFAMKDGAKPGRRIGTMDAREVNYAIATVSRLVDSLRLPPKVLVIHRFTRRMLTDARHIRLDPRVQVVVDMDGFGAPFLKHDTYRDYVATEPVEFTGFKLFYKNDKPMMTPWEVLELWPRPVYIQYQ